MRFNMNEIENQLNEYINNKIYNYGFLIKGQWGSGKSYFVKEFIKKNNNDSKVFFNISLNGLTSIEDIDIKLVEEMIKNIKNNKIHEVKLKDITKQVNFKNILGIINKDYPNVILNSILDLVTDSINKENVILVFDDLERCKIKYDELLAYINSYIEIQEMKVILIANEDEIHNDEYERIKEKSIGHSIEFIPNIKENYSIFINNIKDNNLKKIMLNNSENLIIELEKQKYSNMRTLQFIIDKFVNLYNIVLKDSDFIDDDVNEVILCYIVFSSIMYKKGQKMYDWKDVEYGYISRDEKYSYDSFRYGFKFIDNYIYNGIIEQEKILEILKKYKDSTLPKDNPYTILKNNYWELEDKDIYEYINNIKELLKIGTYKSGNILDILVLLLKIQNIGYILDINEFMELFKEIINRDFENNILEFNNSFVSFIDTDENVREQYFIESEKLRNYITDLRFKTFNTYINDGSFSKLCVSVDSNINYNFINDNGFFCNVEIENLIKKLLDNKNTTLELMNFKYFCDKLFNSTIYMGNMEKEIECINKIIIELEKVDIKDNINRKNAIKCIIDNLKKNIESKD